MRAYCAKPVACFMPEAPVSLRPPKEAPYIASAVRLCQTSYPIYVIFVVKRMLRFVEAVKKRIYS